MSEQKEADAIRHNCPACERNYTTMLETIDRVEREQQRLNRQQKQLAERQGAIEYALRGGGLNVK